MAITHTRAKRKNSGGLYKKYRKKKKYELGASPTMTKLGKDRAKRLIIRGRNIKFRLLSAETANLYDPKSKKYFKLKINSIVENPANRHFVRRNILTKGTIIETEKGKARVVNRPGQEKTINAVLIA